MAKSEKSKEKRSAGSPVPAAPKERGPVHGTRPGDKVSGDRIVVTCRKPPSKGWESIRRSEQHHAYRAVARMDAHATVEQGYTNIRSEDAETSS